MELAFHVYPSEEEIMYVRGDEVSMWPWIPRIGETIDLRYQREGNKIDIRGVIEVVHWTSVSGLLNAVDVYIKPLKQK